uniref:GDNF domain-containing protein n=1 Tax=Steinernema glaseri TaxID=37863 RepID=A0A1I7ZH82_9BILA
MKWLLTFSIFAIGLCVAVKHSQVSACKENLASLRSVCGSSSAVCGANSLSDCVDRIRSVRQFAHSISYTDFYCLELKNAVRNHPCEGTLRAVERRHESGRRGVRSPSAESIRRWRNQLRTALHREVHTISQSNESCYHALYDNCLRHVSCRELWKIFRQLCVVDAQNQCRMTSKEDCWQSFEGISWTGLGTCTCSDDNSDCHWIRLQTNYNKCIYEILQEHGGLDEPPATSTVQSAGVYRRPDNMYVANNGHTETRRNGANGFNGRSSQPQPAPFSTNTAQYSHRTNGAAQNQVDRRYPVGTPIVEHQNRHNQEQKLPTSQRESSERPTGAKEYDRSANNNGRYSPQKVATIQTTSSPRRVQNVVYNGRDRVPNGRQLETTSPKQQPFYTTPSTSPSSRRTSPYYAPDSRRGSIARNGLPTQRPYAKPSVSSYSVQVVFTTPRTTSSPLVASREQRRREHELFLQQQRERHLAEQKRKEAIRRQQEALERAEAKIALAAEERASEDSLYPPPLTQDSRPQDIELRENLNGNGATSSTAPTPTSTEPPPTEVFPSSTESTTSTTELPLESTTSTSTSTSTSTTSTSTTQAPTTKGNDVGSPQSVENGKERKKAVKPVKASKGRNGTMRPPSWRLAKKLRLQPTTSTALPIVTTETVSTNLERPPTSTVMNRSAIAVNPAIRRFEEDANEDDDEYDEDGEGGYGGGLHFHSDVVFSRRRFRPTGTYNESTCTRAHRRCALDETCKWHLSEVQMKCTVTERCNRDRCAEAIQRFTQYVPKPLVEAMMFCHCMVSDVACVEQQQWMYPRCLYAEQREIGPITCTEAVEKCRSEANCEHYSTLFFQLCSQEGGQCTNADLDRCRHALIEVRATFLEFPCYCVQSDLDCRRIQNGMLPNNPCVEKSMMEYSRQLEGKFLEPFTPNPPATINSNAIDPSAATLTATSNRSSPPLNGNLSNGHQAKPKLPATLQPTSTQLPPRRTSTATTTGRKVKLEIEPESKRFNESRYELGASRQPTTPKPVTRVPLIAYTSEELKDREPMPEGGCYTKNSVGSWIRHYKDTIIRKSLEWSGRCSSWCECDKDGNLSCRSLKCQPNVTCEVEETTVFFGQKLYLKDRGACTCCEDNFVCQLPTSLEPLEKGLYVFAGYSHKELELLRKEVPQNVLERSGFVSAHRDVARDISSQLQQALERVMPLTEKCRLVLLEHYVEEHIIMHQVQWYGINQFGNDTKPKWQTGMLEKICSPYVRKLAAVFEVSDAGRHQLVLSVVKQVKVVDMLDDIPENTASTVVLHFCVVLVVLFAQLFLN